MSKEIAGKIKNWDKYYIDNENKAMPWYSKSLDNDIKTELEKRKISGGTFLDLGTGPGTQAFALSEMGFEVTGVDISERAIEKAKLLNTKVNYIRDNILDAKLSSTFDYIMDRGCFHVFKPEQRELFVKNVFRLLNSGGLYFLKCFSHKQEGERGPQRISPDDVHNSFGKMFHIISIEDSVFDGEKSSMPKALFVVMEKE